MAGQALLDAAKVVAALQGEQAKLACSACSYQDVNQALVQAKAVYAKVHNEQVAVSQLPNEILAEIFYLCQDNWAEISSRGFGLKPFEITASQVTKVWREIVLGTQLFWSTINLAVCPQTRWRGRELQRLETYLARSGRQSLDIFIRVIDSGSFSEFLYPLAAHSFRWRRISFFLSAEQRLHDVHRSFHLVESPTLEHFSVVQAPSFFRPLRRDIRVILNPILTFGTPSLSFVRLSLTQGTMNVTPPLGDVTTLHIDFPAKDTLTTEQLQNILRMAPRLVNLSLTSLTVLPAASFVPTFTPHLRSLRIRNSPPCSTILSIITPDRLQRLTLHGMNTFTPGTVLSSLQSLTLESCHLPDIVLEAVLRAFPDISSLTIDGSAIGIYKMLGARHLIPPGWSGSMPPGVLLRNLKTLSIRCLHPFAIMSLGCMVYDRRFIHIPITSMRLDAHSEETLRAASVLSELSAIVNLERCEQLDPWPAGLGYNEPSDGWVS